MNFTALNKQYLQGRMTPEGWTFQAAHPTKPGADFYVSSYQVFSTNGLSVSLIIRNGMDGKNNVISATPLVALGFSRKQSGRYLLSEDEDKVVIPLYLDQAIQLFAFLRGSADSTFIEVVRPGVKPKHLKGYLATSGLFRYMLKASTSDETNNYRSIEVALSAEHVFQLQAHLLALGNLVHPWLDQGTVVDLFMSAAAPPTLKAPVAQEPLSERPYDDQRHPSRAYTPAADLDPERVAKAVFAVGINKWPPKRRDVIRHIQETATLEAMDRLIKAGNEGDFTEWNRIAELMD